MVFSTLKIKSWTDKTNKAVFTCYAKNQEGGVESRKAVVTNGILKILIFILFFFAHDESVD